jgi:hypothetical protein
MLVLPGMMRGHGNPNVRVMDYRAIGLFRSSIPQYLKS